MKVLSIKDICDKGSSNLKQKDVEGEKGKYPVYGASGIISHLETYHQEENYIAIVKDGSGIGRISFMPAKSSVIGTLQYILPKKGFNIKYIGYCLQSLNLSKYKQGTAIPHIYFRDYGKREVNVTEDTTEQQAIVEYLDTAFAKIDQMKANAEKSLNEVQGLFQSAISESLTPQKEWSKKSLKDISEIYGDYGLSVPSTKYNGVRYLRITDITAWGSLNDDKVSADVTDCDQDKLEDGDILFARTGATVGKTLIYNKDFGDCLFAGYLIRYRLKKDIILPRYMFYLTHSKEYYRWVLENQKAAAQPNISAKLYNNLLVHYPNLEQQNKIVSTLDGLFSKVCILVNNYNTIISECESLKQAILKQVFE